MILEGKIVECIKSPYSSDWGFLLVYMDGSSERLLHVRCKKKLQPLIKTNTAYSLNVVIESDYNSKYNSYPTYATILGIIEELPKFDNPFFDKQSFEKAISEDDD
jgi:hypothetical protein